MESNIHFTLSSSTDEMAISLTARTEWSRACLSKISSEGLALAFSRNVGTQYDSGCLDLKIAVCLPDTR